MMRKTQWQKHEATGHIASTVRKQRERNVHIKEFLLFSFVPVNGVVLSIFKMCLLN